MEKKSKKSPTPRQFRAAKAILKNLSTDNPASLGRVLKNVGYGSGLQNQPGRVLHSTGFKLALRQLGLTEDLITTALVSDINAKPKNRIQELKLGAEILGMVKREEPDDTPKSSNTYNFIFNAETQQKIKAIEAEIKEKLINPDAKTP